MLAKRIIPCLDVNHGRVVKGKQFHHLQDVDDPVALGNTTPTPALMNLSFMTLPQPTKGGKPLWTL